MLFSSILFEGEFRRAVAKESSVAVPNRGTALRAFPLESAEAVSRNIGEPWNEGVFSASTQSSIPSSHSSADATRSTSARPLALTLRWTE